MPLHIIQWISGLLNAYGLAGLIFGTMILSLATTFLPVPVDLVILYAIERGFDPALIIAAVTIGTTLAACIDYFLGHAGSQWMLKRIKKESFERTHAWLEKWGVSGIILASFIPLPFEIFAVAAGVLKMRFHKFVFATLAGKLIKYVLTAYFGSYLLRLFGL